MPGVAFSSARPEEEGTRTFHATALKACYHVLHACFPLNVSPENLAEVVLQLCAEFPAAFRIMMCSANKYSHVQGSWESQCLFQGKLSGLSYEFWA